MLSLWKLRVGTEGYYLAQVASGIDDYYTGAGEATGEWLGGGAEALGLAGAVAAEDLRAVMAGLAPGTGLTPNGMQLAARRRRVPGFDLTFAVPKSVSVLYALGDPLVQAAVVEAGEAAVNEALGWLERDACFVRRGTNNSQARVREVADWGTRRMATGGFVAARFRHRTSRAGDPHLHWHVLVANLAQGVDGRWSALDGQALYAAKRAGGVLFQAVLRDQLSGRLGIEWGPLHRDSAEIAGIPRHVLRMFSTRREQIREWLDDHGREGPAAAAEAMAATRTAKATVPAEGLTGLWIERSRVAGWGPEQLEVLLGNAPAAGEARSRTPTGDTREGDASFPGWLDRLVSGLTAHDASFTSADVLEAVAGALGAGAPLPDIERLAQSVLADRRLVPLAVPGPDKGIQLVGQRVADRTARRWTTSDLLEIEERFMAQVTGGIGVDRGALSTGAAATALASLEAEGNGLSFGPDQRAAVVALVTGGNAVEVLVGRAGTGKTTALAAVRVAYGTAGYQVWGLAPSARAAREMESGAGVTSQTIARFLHRPDRARLPADGRTVVVVDEAAMAGTRDLAATLDAVLGAGGKVILVGDHHQLPEIAAGGGFSAALGILGDRACELTVNRRQTEPWERDALDELRHGDVTAAWDAYRDHDRVVLADDPEALHALVIDDWWRLRAGGRDVLAVAGTRAEAALLNRLARDRVEAAGCLSGAELLVDGHGFRRGDRVVLRRNSNDQHRPSGDRTTVANGMLADVEAVDIETGAVTVRFATGEVVVLDGLYVEGGHVEHGYAVTIHKAQGLTCDDILVVGPSGLNREAAYVAMSRARHSAHLYAAVPQTDDTAERHQQGIPLPSEASVDPEEAVLARLHRSGAKTFASRLDPDALAVSHLAASHSARDLTALATRARDAERHAGNDPDAGRGAADRARLVREHLAIGGRVRALDRDNVGTVVGLDDRAATAKVRFVSASGTSADRRMEWSQLLVIDNPPPLDISPVAARTLRRMERAAEEALDRWREQLQACGFAPGDAGRLARAADLVADRAAHTLRAESPEWLTCWLGVRPSDQVGALVWDDALDVVASWRAGHDLPVGVPGLGSEPIDVLDAQRWRETTIEMLSVRSWIVERGGPPMYRPKPLPPGELAARRTELEAVLSEAPPDQSRIAEDLRSGRLSTSDLHRELAEIAVAQEGRRAWILEHWPHLVELEQIDLLLSGNDLLAHWAPADDGAVHEALEALRHLAPEPGGTETRTLAELAEETEALDPVRALAHRVAELDIQAGRLRRDVRQVTDPAARTVLEASVTAASGARRQALTALETARHDADLRQLYTDHGVNTGPETNTAAERRTAAVVRDAFVSRPAWLLDLLRGLDAAGGLTSDPDALTALVADIAVYRDRWALDQQAPLGAPPDDPAGEFVRDGLLRRLDQASAGPALPMEPA